MTEDARLLAKVRRRMQRKATKERSARAWVAEHPAIKDATESYPVADVPADTTEQAIRYWARRLKREREQREAASKERHAPQA